MIKTRLKSITPKLVLNIYKKLRYGDIQNKTNLFYEKNKYLKGVNKIIYTLTPPPELPNIGDHAQVVAIYKWLESNYHGKPILEVDKNECINEIEALKKIANDDDLIFIHSGGNLGDRGIWSETGRRNIIKNFPNNKIIVLPQTIFFSETQKGKEEAINSEKIYNDHDFLRVIARDYESLELAKKLFPKSNPFAIPDFVLSLRKEEYIKNGIKPSKHILFCLRNDDESILSDLDRENLINYLETGENEIFDTTLLAPLEIEQREYYVKKTLEHFSDFEVIITDRFHGVIFATILNKPIIVLPTVDHKLTSAIKWFEGMPQIKYIAKEEIPDIKKILDIVISEKPVTKDWNDIYFSNLKEKISE